MICIISMGIIALSWPLIEVVNDTCGLWHVSKMSYVVQQVHCVCVAGRGYTESPGQVTGSVYEGTLFVFITNFLQSRYRTAVRGWMNMPPVMRNLPNCLKDKGLVIHYTENGCSTNLCWPLNATSERYKHWSMWSTLGDNVFACWEGNWQADFNLRVFCS